MRRKDREVTGRGEILAILEKCPVMRLGLSDGERPYVVPLNFAYVEDDGALTLYFHCAAEGRKLDIIARNPRVCFEADCAFALEKGARPCDWSAFHESVIGEGRACIVTDAGEKKAALDAIMLRYGFEGKPEYDERLFSRTCVVKIEAAGVTGKRKAQRTRAASQD